MAPNSMDIKWSGRKMEGGDVLKTMECLRRRLLAERQASFLAKEEAELMGKRSRELEKQITEQIEMKTKAEKKLQLFRKKLKSLNLSSTMLNPDPSVSSEICDEDDAKILIAASSSLPSNVQASAEVSHLEENPNARVCAGSSSSASETCCDEPSKAKIENGGEEFISMGNPLALVVASLPGKSETSELKPVINESIIEVLNDLKHARERIQSSIEICELTMIKIGPV